MRAVGVPLAGLGAFTAGALLGFWLDNGGDQAIGRWICNHITKDNPALQNFVDRAAIATKPITEFLDNGLNNIGKFIAKITNSTSANRRFGQFSDPNALYGPAGFGSSNFVDSSTILPYRIDFKNATTATALLRPACSSSPTRLDADLDWNDPPAHGHRFRQHTSSTIPPPDSQDFETTVSMTYNGSDLQRRHGRGA